MFLDRRSLLQSAAGLLVPSTATIPTLRKPASRQLTRAVELYFSTFTAYYGKPFRPDDNSVDAHDRADKDLDTRRNAFDDARRELRRLVMAHHGIDEDSADCCAPLRGCSVDVGDVTVLLAVDTDPQCEGGPLGNHTLAVIPRTPAGRARIDALPTLDPVEYASKEEEKRLQIPMDEPPPAPPVDLSRMPADEPIPLTAKLWKSSSPPDNGETEIIRTWTAEGAMNCKRCECCAFVGHTLESIAEEMRKGKVARCNITVKDEDVEKVLYGRTPLSRPEYRGDGILMSTEWQTGEPNEWEDIVVATPEAWAKNWRAKYPSWQTYTQDGTLMAVKVWTGPIPWIINPDLELEPAQVEPAATESLA